MAREFFMINFGYFTDYRKVSAFLLAGVVGLGVETIVLVLLKQLGIGLYLSKLAALEAAILIVFLINDNYAFDDLEKKTYALIRTNLVRSGGTLLSFLGLYLGVRFNLHYLLANTIGVVMGSVFNYYFERVMTWE